MRPIHLAAIMALAILLLGVSPAIAGGNGAQSTTEHVHKVTETFTDILCEEGTLYEITITYNAVFYETLTSDGGIHATFTAAGSFVAVPLNPSLDTVTGHFAQWGGFNLNH